MKTYNDPNKLKDELLKNSGLIITNRRSGKTTALLNILHEFPDKILVVPTQWARSNAARLYKKMFNLTHDEFKKADIRIIDEKTFWGKRGLRKEQILVDEYFEFEQAPKFFFAAVGSMFFPVQIIQVFDKEPTELKKIISEEEYSLSISLKFDGV